MFSTGMLQFEHTRMRGLLKWLHTRNLLLPSSWKTYFLAVSYRFNEFFWSKGNDLLWAGIISVIFDAGASWILRRSRNIKIFRRFRLSLLLHTQDAPTCSARFSPAQSTKVKWFPKQLATLKSQQLYQVVHWSLKSILKFEKYLKKGILSIGFFHLTSATNFLASFDL